jgi:hypothetical protein
MSCGKDQLLTWRVVAAALALRPVLAAHGHADGGQPHACTEALLIAYPLQVCATTAGHDVSRLAPCRQGQSWATGRATLTAVPVPLLPHQNPPPSETVQVDRPTFLPPGEPRLQWPSAATMQKTDPARFLPLRPAPHPWGRGSEPVGRAVSGVPQTPGACRPDVRGDDPGDARRCVLQHATDVAPTVSGQVGPPWRGERQHAT